MHPGLLHIPYSAIVSWCCQRIRQRHQAVVIVNIGVAAAIVVAHRYRHRQQRPNVCSRAYACVSFSPQPSPSWIDIGIRRHRRRHRHQQDRRRPPRYWKCAGSSHARPSSSRANRIVQNPRGNTSIVDAYFTARIGVSASLGLGLGDGKTHKITQLCAAPSTSQHQQYLAA